MRSFTATSPSGEMKEVDRVTGRDVDAIDQAGEDVDLIADQKLLLDGSGVEPLSAMMRSILSISAFASESEAGVVLIASSTAPP
jgi:hypothetical protein